MHKVARILVCAVVFAALLCASASPILAQSLVREKLPNDIGIELLGKSLIYSFYYQRTLNRNLGLEAGLGALGGSSGDDNATLLFFPVGAKFYVIPKNGTFFISGGAVFLNASTGKGPFSDDSSSSSYGYLGPGFEFRSETGFLFRGTAYGLIAGGGFFIWPGLTVGYGF
jgi:hypothetical protein